MTSGMGERVLRVYPWAARGCVLMALVVAALLAGGESVLSLERTDRQQALLATVQVVVPDNSGSPISAGSGTVLDADRGLILTNYHVVGSRIDEKYFNDEKIAVIGVNPPTLRGTPIFRYYARVLRADAEIDLALLEVFAPFENINGALPANLGLTSVERGSSGALEIGDPIYVLGFPGLGGDTVTYTEGIVSGFLDEDRDGAEEWIKTDAEVNHGNSGGLAVNDSGEFIGVPSAGYTDADSAGKISLIRPGDMAMTYYDAWTVASNQQGQNAPPSNNSNQSAEIVNVVYGAGIGEDGRATDAGVRFPSGTTALYVSFDYRNIARTDRLGWRWYADGTLLDEGTINRGRNESGNDWLSLSNAGGLADGLYELELHTGTSTLYRGGVQVGEDNPGSASRIGPLTFAAGVADDGSPIGQSASFANVHEVFALFDASNLRRGALVKSVWSYEGEEVLTDEAPWTDDGMRTGWVSIRHPDGLPVGGYRLVVFVNGVEAQSGDFRVTERAQANTQTVQVVGTIRDADNTRRLINGALVMLLQPGTTVQNWVDSGYDDALILAQGGSNRSGEFTLDKRVETGKRYAVVVVHDDYRAIAQDEYQIPADSSDPYVLDATMQRK